MQSNYIRSLYFFALALVLFLYGCEPEADRFKYTDPQELVTISQLDKGMLNVNDVKFGIRADGVHCTNDGLTFTTALYSGRNVSAFVSCAGLWLGTDNPTPKVNLVSYSKSTDRTNFTHYLDTIRAGLYYVTPAKAEYVPSIPLVRLGFPVYPNGKVKIYGDEMYWTALQGKTIPGNNLFSSPIYFVNVNQTVFAYNRFDLRNVIFIRYDIKNVSGADINNLYAGYWSDTDVEPMASGNSTGYDSERAFTYTYSKAKIFSPDSCIIAGFTFAESPAAGMKYPHGVSSHRIMRKNNYINPEFGEVNFGARQAVYALKGLSNDGKPMTNPVTEELTNYAFTGDPVTGTGWTDASADSRNLLNSGPFTLRNDETKTLVVIWICSAYGSLKANLSAVRDQLDQIRNEPSLWNK
ncbi:MAG: hypothetical protein ACM3Q2_10060 [Syntrophothermus sp.]